MTYAQIFSLPLWIFGGVMLFYGLVATFSPSVRGYDFFRGVAGLPVSSAAFFIAGKMCGLT